MRINWFSNSPAASTGYGVQTKLFVPRLAKLLDGGISVTAFYGVQGGILNIGGIKVYPGYRDPHGTDIIGAHAIQDGADAIISLVDAWILKDKRLPVPWFPWFPVDHEPMPVIVRDAVSQATKGIVMSMFGKRMADQAGLDVFYVPHGVDTKVFKPLDRNEARERLKWPKDKFIVGMVAANKDNPSRKAFCEQIAAFKILQVEHHGDCVLYLHTDDGMNGGNGVNLRQFCNRMGLKVGEDVIFSDQYMTILGFPDGYMVDVYNALDVLTNVSRGEGFGVPIIEAQSCGTPVIVGDWTSMSELCFGGWKAVKDKTLPVYTDFFDAFQYQATAGATYELMEQAYQKRGDQELRDKAQQGALEYDVDLITEKYWKPVINEMREMIEGLK